MYIFHQEKHLQKYILHQAFIFSSGKKTSSEVYLTLGGSKGREIVHTTFVYQDKNVREDFKFQDT